MSGCKSLTRRASTRGCLFNGCLASLLTGTLFSLVVFIKYPMFYGSSGLENPTTVWKLDNLLVAGVNGEDRWLGEIDRRNYQIDKVCSSVEDNARGNFTRHGGKRTHVAKSSLGSQVMVHHEYKILYCSVPKAACSSWKWFLYCLSGRHDYDHPEVVGGDIHKRNVLQREGFVFWSSLSDSQREEVVNSREYTKLLVVRHPLDRLVSAYKDKFVKQVHGLNKVAMCQACGVYGVPILQRYRPRVTADHLETGENVTIKELVLSIVEQKRPLVVAHDPHFDSIDRICDPCNMRYDYVLRVENLEEDSTRFIHRTFPNTSMLLRHRNKHTQREGKKTDPYSELKQLPRQLQIKLYHKYRQDLEFFNYDWPIEKPANVQQNDEYIFS